MLLEDDAWRLRIELFAFLHFKSCGKNFESQFNNLLSQVYTWQDRDAKKFFTWCRSLDYADNRFCPVSLQTAEFQRFAERFKECVQQVAFECLAREDPEGAMETTSLWDNWSNALFAINPLAFCTLWEHIAAHNFAFAVDVFKWMTSPDIVRWFGISARRIISLAWHILVGEATCGNTGAHDEKVRALLALAEQTYGSYKPDITEEPYFTLWPAVLAATGWCSPEFVSDFLEKVPPDVVSKYGSVIGISMIRRHCDALVFLSNRKVQLGLDDAEKVAPLLIEHLTVYDARDWCLETQRLWELFPGISCNEVLDLAIEELAKRRKPLTRLARLANFLTDETMQCTALVRIMESAQGTLEERKGLLTKALILLGHANSETPSFAAALFNLCRIVSQWPKEDAKLALQNIYNIAKETPLGDNARRPEILIEPIRFMAKIAPQYAAKWSAEIKDENVLASIIEEWAIEDLNAAIEFACTVAFRLQQSGKILWDKEKIRPDTLGRFLFLMRGANSWSDYLLFQDEEERRILELARSNIVGALEAAACRPNSEAFVRRLCCNLPVTLDGTIVQWFAEECRDPLRAWIADSVVERIIHSEACRALDIIAGMDRDDLLEAFVERKDSSDSYTLDRLSRTAFDFIDKKSGADLDYDRKRIRILARAALCRAETYGCYRVMAWVAKNCPELILELLPKFLERLAATCTNPEEVVNKATSAMKQAHKLQSVGIR